MRNKMVKKIKKHGRGGSNRRRLVRSKTVRARGGLTRKSISAISNSESDSSIALNRRPLFLLNPDFEFFYELRDLILKSSPTEKDTMAERVNKLGRIRLVIISGIFLNKDINDPLATDILIVGDDIDRRKLHALLRSLEADAGKEIRFAVMDKEEFQYRLAMFDRFIRVLLEGPHEKLINKIGI